MVNDLEELIRQSRYEDFYDDKREAVYVSTIHKSKGREFDVVYLFATRGYQPSQMKKSGKYMLG